LLRPLRTARGSNRLTCTLRSERKQLKTLVWSGHWYSNLGVLVGIR